MAITSVGYDGTVDEKQFRDIMGFSASSEYGVAEAGGFTASSVAGQVLQVRLTAGTAWTAGVVDKMDAAQTVQLQAVTSGARWDMIVLRRDYQPPGGATTLQVVKGSASMAIPARASNPGILDEQPLWLVKVESRSGQSVIAQYVDLRVWARNGGATANHDLVRSYLNGVGTEVEINGTVWLLRVGANGQSEWVALSKSAHVSLLDGASYNALRNSLALRDKDGAVQVASPASANEAANKAYVDAQVRVIRNLLDGSPRTLAGSVTITPKPNTPTSAYVKFAVPGWLRKWPAVTVTADSSVIGDIIKGVSVDDVSRDGFRVWVNRTNNTPTRIYWIATDA